MTNAEMEALAEERAPSGGVHSAHIAHFALWLGIVSNSTTGAGLIVKVMLDSHVSAIWRMLTIAGGIVFLFCGYSLASRFVAATPTRFTVANDSLEISLWRPWGTRVVEVQRSNMEVRGVIERFAIIGIVASGRVWPLWLPTQSAMQFARMLRDGSDSIERDS